MKMDFTRCYSCMRELDKPGGRCPHCGFDNATAARTQSSHALPCGFLLRGRYVIGRMLGQGGFGVTYIGWDLALELRVCIKEYFPAGAAMRSNTMSTTVTWSGGENAEELKRGRESFIKEARKAVKLRKLNAVVQVWDVFYENDTAYLVMDYVDGVTLKNHLIDTRRPLSEEECVRLFMPVMQDLEEVHARGIIHRDISPDNLMLQPDGSLVLLDIGAAKDLSGGNGQSSVLVAKKGFSPLEQYASGGDIGPWTDVYALCATIVYCVTGKLLPSPMDRITGEDLDLSVFTSSFAEVLQKGLAIRPEERIQNMDALKKQLEEAVQPCRHSGLTDLKEQDGRISADVLQDLKQVSKSGGRSEAEHIVKANRNTTARQNIDAKSASKENHSPNGAVVKWAVAAILLCAAFLIVVKLVLPAQALKQSDVSRSKTAIAAGIAHTVGLSNGEAIAAGNNTFGQCDVSGWTDVVAVAAGFYHTIGLRADGTVVAVGNNNSGQCDVSNWHGIVAVAASAGHTIGLRSDGTVVAVGKNDSGQCNVSTWRDIVAIATSRYHTVGLRSDGRVVAVGRNNNHQCNVSDWTDIVEIAAGDTHTVGLRSDGTVVATGSNSSGQCDVTSWKDIVSIAAGGVHTVGLRSDGTVIAVGQNDVGQCDVQSWKNIVAVATERNHTIGLRSDGTFVAVGQNADGQCDVQKWKNISSALTAWSHIEQVAHNAEEQPGRGFQRMSIAVGHNHTVGLRSDGTVVAVGENSVGQCNVSGWTDIVSVAAGSSHTVGLRSDGTVISVGRNYSGQCDVSNWTDIVVIAAGPAHTAGLRSDGTVVTAGSNDHGECDTSTWKNIVAIAAGRYHTIGLCSDGTVVAAGDNSKGQCSVSEWTDIVAIAAGDSHTVGLCSNGTVLAVGDDSSRQCNTEKWHNIAAIAAGGNHTIGLHSDGTVVALNMNSLGQSSIIEWKDVVAIATERYHTVGLHSDGTVTAVGENDDGKCNVSDWKDIALPK